MKLVLTAIAMILPGIAFAEQDGNGKNLGPTETFLNYHEVSKSNDDFSVEESYQSSEKVELVRERLPFYQKNMKLKSIESVKERYLTLIRGTASCMGLNPVSEEIKGTRASLEFIVEDRCNGHKGAIQKVLMVKESNQWKIESTELVL